MAQNTPGNVDLYAQPKVKNPDGSISTVDSRSYNIDGQETLLPSVTPDGRHLATDEAIVAEYRKTGRHLGKFDSVDASNKYATQLHNDYAAGKYEKKPMADSFDYSKLAAQYPMLAQLSGGFHPDSAPLSDAPETDTPAPRTAGFMQMLQSAAHPQTTGDIASLLLPSGISEMVSPARRLVQSGVDAAKTADTSAGVFQRMAKAGAFSGDRTVQGVGGLEHEAPGGLGSLSPADWEKLTGKPHMPSRELPPLDPRDPPVMASTGTPTYSANDAIFNRATASGGRYSSGSVPQALPSSADMASRALLIKLMQARAK